MIGLENLASVLETGQDLRIVRRPLLGINIGDFGPERAAQFGIPVNEGIRLEDVVPGMGADQAGLQKNDVIVSVSGKPVTDYSNLTELLRNKKAGDKLEIVYYRGGKINITSLQLSTRKLPAVPPDITALMKAVHEDYEAIYRDLANCFKEVSEADAAHSPAPGEWSAKEVLAHIIHNERDLHAWISDLVNNEERVTDGFSENVQARIAATISVYPRIEDLLTEFKRHQTETMGILVHLPENFDANKGSYWRMGAAILQVAPHVRAHLDQLQKAIKSAQA